jgi:hypothetical protein
MITSKSNVAYNTLISLRDKLTCINGAITPEAIDKLKDELGRIFMVTKTHHYEQGQKYGHLASAIPEQKYRLVIGNATWAHTVPGDPGAYLQAALGVGNSAALQEQHMAEHKILQKSYNDYLGIKEAGKELILFAVGKNALAPVKKLYIGFGDSTVLKMIDHLHLKTAIKMTTAQKHEDKTMGYNNPWYLTTSITAYFTQLDPFQLSLGNRGIAMSEAKKTMAAGAQMWQSKMFTEDQMVTWENKPAVQQTWATLQAYFTEKWLERKQYSATTAKQLQFKEAALLSQEKAAAKEEGELQAMLFAMLHKQYNNQIAVMTETHKANMNALMEKMNAILAGGGEKQTAQHDKDNTPPGWNRRPLAGQEQEWIKPRSHKNKRPSVPTAKRVSSTNQITVPSLRQTRPNNGRAGSPFMPSPDKHQGRPQ